MSRKKTTKQGEETPEVKSDYTHVIHRFDKVLNFPAGWDQGRLHADRISQIREYLREKKGAEAIETEIHTSSNKIEGKPRTRQTALFFVQTVPGGELHAGGNPIQALKGQLAILPAGADFKIKATTHSREIIEFTF